LVGFGNTHPPCLPKMAIDGQMDVEKERKLGPELACGVCFYLVLLAQLIVAFAIFGMKNSEMPN